MKNHPIFCVSKYWKSGIMPQINGFAPSNPHVNRTPTLFDCCVMHVWRWYMPIGCGMVPNIPHTGVKIIRIFDKTWRRTAEPPPTIAMAANTPSIGCIDAWNKRVLAVLSTTMSSEEVTGDKSLIFRYYRRREVEADGRYSRPPTPPISHQSQYWYQWR